MNLDAFQPAVSGLTRLPRRPWHLRLVAVAAAAAAQGSDSAARGNSSPVTGAPTFFYSRRIGLERPRGADSCRRSCHGSPWKVDHQRARSETGEEPIGNISPTNFSVVRLRRNIPAAVFDWRHHQQSRQVRRS